MNENPPLLELVDFFCVLPDGRPLFDALNFALRPSGAVLLEGATGQGKSSLLLSLRGIQTDGIRCEGAALYRGRPITPEERRAMGLVLQNPHSQMLSTLVEEELRSGLDFHRNTAGAAPDLLDATIEILGLRPLLQIPTRHLSAGQKHLVAIGSIGVLDYPILLLDEPFLYLDPRSAARVLEYVDFLRARGTGVLIASHPKMQDENRFDQVARISRRSPASAREKKADAVSPVPRNTRSAFFAESDAEVSTIALLDADIGYDGAPPVARNISLTVRAREEVWIVGPNGSGKTTLLKTLSGQLSPLTGERTQCGNGGAPAVYLIPQNPDRFFFEASVLREMMAPVVFACPDKAREETAREEARALLERMELASKSDLSPAELSFGERIRLAAAQAALLKPDFLLVDDVLAFCDPREQKILLDFFREIQRRGRCGLVFATSHQAPPEIPNGNGQVLVLDPPLPSVQPFPSTPSISSIQSLQSIQQRTRPRKKSSWRRLLRQAPFEYVSGRSPIHGLPLWAKIGICIVFWAVVTTAGPRWFPLVALAGIAYYLLASLGGRRFLIDTQYFVFQAVLFMVILGALRRNFDALVEGAVRGAQVWLFFLPIVVLMRTSTLDQWIAQFQRVLSRQKRIVLGISLGFLPCVLMEIKEVLQIQSLKGFVPRKRYLLHPAQLWNYSRAVLVPIVLLIEDMAGLAEISVTLRGYEE